MTAMHEQCCGKGPLYFETCGQNGGPDPDCVMAVADECQSCGHRTRIICPDHEIDDGSAR